jgi:hypothetical protein
VLFKLFFAKEYLTNKALNTENKILMKKKVIFWKKMYVMPKFEQHFELISRTVKLNLLTRKSTDKNMEVAQIRMSLKSRPDGLDQKLILMRQQKTIILRT